MQLQHPRRAKIAYKQQLAVFVLCNLDKAVVIVKEMRLVTVRQHLRHGLPAARKAAQNVFRADVVPAALYTVRDACKALLRRVKADIEQPDGIAVPLGSGCCLRRAEA